MAMPTWVRVFQVVDPTLQPDKVEEWTLQEIHWHIELQHERCKDHVPKVQNYNDEHPMGRECILISQISTAVSKQKSSV